MITRILTIPNDTLMIFFALVPNKNIYLLITYYFESIT